MTTEKAGGRLGMERERQTETETETETDREKLRLTRSCHSNTEGPCPEAKSCSGVTRILTPSLPQHVNFPG